MMRANRPSCLRSFLSTWCRGKHRPCTPSVKVLTVRSAVQWSSEQQPPLEFVTNATKPAILQPPLSNVAVCHPYASLRSRHGRGDAGKASCLRCYPSMPSSSAGMLVVIGPPVAAPVARPTREPSSARRIEVGGARAKHRPTEADAGHLAWNRNKRTSA